MVFEIRDAVYGDIVLREDEARLLDTYEMQRLRYIGQLGNVRLVYPSANNTRFEHCLGTRWLVQKIVRISDLQIKQDDERILYKCALLHDIAEPAFAHVTERLNEIGLPTHEQIIEYVLDGTYKKRVLEKKNVRTNFVCDVITDDGERDAIRSILAAKPTNIEKPSLRELINGYIDADNLDYLRRDSYFLGLPYGNYDDRIFAAFKVVKTGDEEHIAFRDTADALNAIMSVLNARYILRKVAYFHHAVIIADDILLKALKDAMSDEDIMNVYDVFICNDYELLTRIQQKDTAAPLIDSLLSRNLFKRIYVVDSEAPTGTRTLIERLRNDAGAEFDFVSQLCSKTSIEADNILLHFSPQSGWKDFQYILLSSEKGGISKLGERLPSELSLLERKYHSLWGFMVSSDALNYEKRQELLKECIDYFGHEGTFSPKKSFGEIQSTQDEVAPLIVALGAEVPASKPILKILIDSNKPMSRDEIASELQLKPATISHYLTLIEQMFKSHSSESILTSRRAGRVKFWEIDKRVREVLNDA